MKAAITEAKAQGQRDLAREPWWQIGQAGFHGEKVEKWLGFWEEEEEEEEDDDDDDDDVDYDYDFKFLFDEIRCFDEKHRVERMMNGHMSDWKKN